MTDYEAHYRPAMKALADLDDDHATVQNMAGFSAADVEFGHSLANQARPWTPKQTVAAYKILRKYASTQLPNLGFSFDKMPVCPSVDEIEEQRARSRTPEEMKAQQPSATLNSTNVIFNWSIDKHFRDRLAMVKELPGRKFNNLDKSWVVPITVISSPDIIAMLDHFVLVGSPFVESSDLRAALGGTKSKAIANLEASSADSSDLVITGLLDSDRMRPFQRAGVAYALEHKRTIIADDMGLGKTLQAIATMTTSNRERVLIVCPASLKRNWLREIEQWTGDDDVIVLEGTQPWQLFPMKWTIINYDLLHAWSAELSLQGFDGVIVDESHYLKSGNKSQRGKAFDAIVKSVKPEYLVMLTGTPMLNRPIELWPLLRIMGGEAHVGGWRRYTERYCEAKQTQFGLDLSGAANLTELNTILRSSGLMIRRRKPDVLKELPPRNWAPVTVTLSKQATSAYDKIVHDATNSKDEGAILKMISDLRQLVATEKIAHVIAWVDEFLLTGEQLVIFGWHREITEAIANHYNAPMIIGGMKPGVVEEGKDAFQTGVHRVIVCNIAAGGVGHTLTAASNVLFVESAWNGALMDQALDRCHRMGQTADSVTGWVMTAERNGLTDVETIDHYMGSMVSHKRAVTTEGVDGALAHTINRVAAAAMSSELDEIGFERAA